MSILPISICIPARNEERNLPECFQSLQGAFDEVVVVDSNSTDSTREIAEKAGAVVIDFRWNGQFPKKRNWALRNYEFKHPWILFLDADERLNPAVIDEFRSVLPTTTHVGFWIKFTNFFMGTRLKHGDILCKLALIRKGSGEYEEFPEDWWSHLDMEVHEYPLLNGTTGNIRTPLDHHDYRGLKHYIDKHNEYSSWEVNRYRWLQAADRHVWDALIPRQRFKYQHLAKWWFPYCFFVMSYIMKRGFLDGTAGWNLARMKMRYFEEVRLKIKESAQAVRGPA